jgi:cell division protein FtsB
MWPLLGALVVVLVLVLGVLPTRTFLAQRSATRSAEERLAVLSEQNAALEQRAGELRDDAEIERLARERYNLVMPGEEAYALLPAAGTPTTGPPDEGAEEDASNPLERLWETVTDLL